MTGLASIYWSRFGSLTANTAHAKRAPMFGGTAHFWTKNFRQKFWPDIGNNKAMLL